MRSYRNVVVRDDGSIEGERTLSPDRWIRFSAHPKLLRVSEALGRHPHLEEPIWALQDGYGSPGLTPSQGWDWSGIRDSSEEALEAMYELAREHLSDEEMEQILGIAV